MAPLAGKPPYGTDERDSYYESSSSSSPQRRVRLPPADNPNKRSSAYDVYDNYLEGGADSSKLSAPPASKGASNRTSGIGAMLMNLGDDDSDSDDDDDDDNPFSSRKPPVSPAAAVVPGTPTSKHAALAAATSSSSSSSSSSSARPSQDQPRPSTSSNNPFNSPPRGASANARPPMQNNNNPNSMPQMASMPHPNGVPPSILQRPPPGPQPIAAPRPGYPAPIAALNLARPEPIVTRGQNPFESPAASPMRAQFAIAPPVPGSPAPSASTPHPLLPPVTPITPVFIKPAIPAPQTIKFEDGVATPRPAKVIMRGNNEETLLPTRGEKGDDFWRRFSIVAKEENRKPSAMKDSSWLKKMQAGSNKHSRSVWIVGIVLIILIAGGIGFGVYATRGSPDNQAPTILGGADGKATAGPVTATSGVKAGATGAAGGKGATSTVLHVSPTFTVDRREEGPVPTGVVGNGSVGTDGGSASGVVGRRSHHHKRRLEW